MQTELSFLLPPISKSLTRPKEWFSGESITTCNKLPLKKTFEKLVILTVRINDLKEITYTNLSEHLPLGKSKKKKKEGGKEQFRT